MSIVLDCSTVLAWCLADECDARADAALEIAARDGAVVPMIWWYELRNALIVCERRSRLTPSDARAILSDLSDLMIVIDRDHDSEAVLELARTKNISIYDAAYLEVSRRHALPLCTLDERMSKAATGAGIALFTAS